MTQTKFDLISFSGKYKILHLTWFAFFLSFFIWFNYAPLMGSIRQAFDLTEQQVKVLLILNVALTIPARIVIGMLVDNFGPKRIYSLLLLLSSILCFAFAFAQTYEQIALVRFLLGCVGAGFVVGIRMISEWFPARQVGVAEGIYGGWGNFGTAAALILPSIALIFGGDDGWRYAVALTGILALIYSVIYFFSVSDTPKGSTYFKPKKSGAMEITSKGDFFLYLIINIPMYTALAALTWKLGPTNINMLNGNVVTLIYACLIGLYLFQTLRIYQINKHVFTQQVPSFDRYQFKHVAVLNMAYFVTFGSEIAVVSMLPLFFMDTFGLSLITAGLLAASFSATNLIARPGGGLLSDKLGRKTVLFLLLIGIAVGYFLMSYITDTWPLWLVGFVTVGCACFVQGGSGAVFAIVPLVKRRLTGQIAGMIGAYGNVGAVVFLTVLSFVSPQVFFLVIAISAVFTCMAVKLFLNEPDEQMAEILPDGTVQIIDVA